MSTALARKSTCASRCCSTLALIRCSVLESRACPATTAGTRSASGASAASLLDGLGAAPVGGAYRIGADPSPAARKAGLLPGDVIERINGLPATAVTAAADGRIFAVESSSSRIVVVATDANRTLTTIAGGTHGRDDGMGNVATLAVQGGLLWDGTALLVSEPSLNRIRRIVPGATPDTTSVETWAGSGVFGSNDGSAQNAQFASPLALSMTATGEVLVVNGGDGSVRKITY